ncbi:MAG: Fic family protein [Leptolyngbyaceae cyanobacterium]
MVCKFLPNPIDNALTQATSETDQAKKLLAVINDGYFTTQALIERLDLSHRATFRKTYLIPVLEARLLEMKYPECKTIKTLRLRLSYSYFSD